MRARGARSCCWHWFGYLEGQKCSITHVCGYLGSTYVGCTFYLYRWAKKSKLFSHKTARSSLKTVSLLSSSPVAAAVLALASRRKVGCYNSFCVTTGRVGLYNKYKDLKNNCVHSWYNGTVDLYLRPPQFCCCLFGICTWEVPTSTGTSIFVTLAYKNWYCLSPLCFLCLP